MIYYTDTTSNNYKKLSGAGTAHFIIFNKSNTNTLSFSIDGQNSVGEISPEEGIEFRDANIPEIYVKSFVPGNHCVYRVWFYGKQSVIYPEEQINKADIQPNFVPKRFESIPIKHKIK